MYNIIITNRRTGEQSILESNLTEQQAEKMCEEWGWMYSDDNNTYYMSYNIKD